MSTVSLPGRYPSPRPHGPGQARGRLCRAVLLGAADNRRFLIPFFLALTFLLGIFPLKDADYFWHLRTGDLIRQSGQVPHVDFYTFTRQGTPWIDLHWIFQVGISWVASTAACRRSRSSQGGDHMPGCFPADHRGRRSWPVWTMILVWLPAVLFFAAECISDQKP